MPATTSRWNEFIDLRGQGARDTAAGPGIAESIVENRQSANGYPSSHASFVKALRQGRSRGHGLTEGMDGIASGVKHGFPPGPESPDPSVDDAAVAEKIKKSNSGLARMILDLLSGEGTAEERLSRAIAKLQPMAQPLAESFPDNYAGFLSRLRHAHKPILESQRFSGTLASELLATMRNERINASARIGLVRGKLADFTDQTIIESVSMFAPGASLIRKLCRR